MTLTIKQEKFCQEYIKCGNASEAYRKSYNASKMKNKTINRKALELLENGMITARINELQKQIEKNSILTARQLQEELTRYILDEKEEECIVVLGCGDGGSEAHKVSKKVQPKDKLKAIELLCKLAGYNADKDNIQSPITINFNRNYD